MPDNAPTNVDDAKGRTKEAVGNLTDDKELEREGKVDRATGTAKEKIDDAAEKAGDAGESVKDRVEGVADKVKDILHKD